MQIRYIHPDLMGLLGFDIYIQYVVKKRDNLPSRSITIRQWPHGNLSTWTHNLQLKFDGSNEPKTTYVIKLVKVTHDK